MSENKTNNQKEVQNYEEQIRSKMRDLSSMREHRKRICNHKPNNHGRVIGLHDSKINVPNKKDMPNSTVICTRCEKYFEGNAYENPGEINDALYMLSSMPEQVKLLANLSKEDEEAIASYYEALDTVFSFVEFYNNMVEKLNNSNSGKKKGGNRNTKGHIGVNSGMFGVRNF